MTYAIRDLDTEIMKKIQERIDMNQREFPALWITQAILSDHEGIEGSDREFAVACAVAIVKQRVRAVCNKFAGTEELEESGLKLGEQFVLPGFDRVHRMYSVNRGTPTLVAIELMTDQEIRAKADEIRSIAMGGIAHADELLRYLNERRLSIVS